jgi:hypothetical protein
MRNPNKYIRQAYITLLAGIGVPIWDTSVPNDVVVPAKYILLSSQTKNEINRTKCDKLWNFTLQVDIFSRGTRGYSAFSINDDIEELVTNIITPNVNTDIDLSTFNFKCYNTFTTQPTDISQQLPNETILHRVLRFRHIIGEI